MARSKSMSTVFRLALAVAAALGWMTPHPASATPGQSRSQAYFGAIAYLRAQGTDAWEGDEAQSVLLGEAIAASPAIVGPRSTTLLSSLELAALDTRGRRGRALAELGFDVSGDTQALLAELALARLDALDLASAALRSSPVQGFGEENTRVPASLDDALALQALAAANAGASGAERLAVEDAILYLLEMQIDAGTNMVAWPRLDRADATGGGVTPDVGVTAQAVLALQPYVATTLTLVPDPALGIDTSLPNLRTRRATCALRRGGGRQARAAGAHCSSAAGSKHPDGRRPARRDAQNQQRQLRGLGLRDGAGGTRALAGVRLRSHGLRHGRRRRR
jgi:hypothetical protein